MSFPTISGIDAIEQATNPDFTLLAFQWFAHVGFDVTIDDKSSGDSVIITVNNKIQSLKDCEGYFLVQTGDRTSYAAYLRPTKKDLANKRLLFSREHWERNVSALNGNVLPKLHYEREWFALPKGLLPEKFADKISAVQLEIDSSEGSVEDALTFEEARRVFPLQVKVANMDASILEKEGAAIQAIFTRSVNQAEKTYQKELARIEKKLSGEDAQQAIADADAAREAAIAKASQIRSVSTDAILVTSLMDLLGEDDYNLWKKAQKVGDGSVLTKYLNRLVEAHFGMPEGMLRSLPEKTAKALYTGIVEREAEVTNLPAYQSMQPQQEEADTDPKALTTQGQTLGAA